MNDEAIQLIDKIQHISDELEHYKKFLAEDSIALFQTNYTKLKTNLEEVMKSNRNLRIGIVGEVKAGKSSFINALLFEGKNILPKAPTPMTAALTKISYSDTFESEIVFYDKNDWKTIVNNAQEADRFLQKIYEQEKKRSPFLISFKQFCIDRKDEVPIEYMGCKELIDMAEENGLQVGEYIGTRVKISADTQEEYNEKLSNYVGAEGQFTPLVKYTIIKMKNERLKNIEIIDTPGMNDPIASRTIVTSDFLLNCDVVFFLSYGGQFLSSEEMELLTRSLPENSINHAYLIASKFDSAILDYKKSRTSLKEALQHTLINVNKQAKEILISYSEKQEAPAIIQALQENLPPHPISGLMYSSAMKIHKNETLTEEEDHILSRFEKRFEGFSRKPQDLMKLANVQILERKVFAKVKIEKETIIQERSETIIYDQQIEFLRIIRQLEEQMFENIQEMKYSDVSNLKNKVEKISTKLQSISKNVNEIFTANYLKASRILGDIKIDIEKEINNHIGVKVMSSTLQESGVRKSGFLNLRKENYTKTVTKQTAEVTEVIASIRKYITRAREMINNEFKRLFDLHSMKKDIATEVVGAFDLVSNEFNESEIKRALEISLNRITIKEIEINKDKYDTKILSMFAATSVQNEEISKLQLEQECILQQIANDIKQEIDKKIKEIEITLEKHAANFIDDIKNQIIVNANKIEVLLKNKEKNLEQMEKIAFELNNFKKQLAQ